MAKLISPYTISSNADPGVVAAVSATPASTTLPSGLYKIGAMSVDLLWKLGSVNVSNSTGSFLAAGDQEVILILTGSTKLSYVRTAGATADGQINIVPVQIYEVPGRDLRNY